MAASIYLEAEDEITAAVSRIRALSETEAVLVLSRGSRIGSSRINFKLLAREAHASGVNLVAVSDEPTVRALAVSAGLPAYDNVAAAEEALLNFRQQDRQLAQRGARLPGEPRSPAEEGTGGTRTLPATGIGAPPRPRPLEGREATRVLGVPAHADEHVPAADEDRAGPSAGARRTAGTAGAGRAVGNVAPTGATAADPALPAERATRRRTRRRVPLAPLLVLGLVAALLATGVYLAYVYLPTATITLRPMTQPLGPLEVRVTADPSAAVVDADAGVIPAQRIELPLAVSGQFPASGVEVIREPATGSVRFTSENTLFDVPIAADTIVSTEDGIEFRTTASVRVPRASFATGPTSVTAEVVAVSPGPRGNVEAEAISEVPADLANALISVTNPRPMSGGARLDQLEVTQEDYDAALEALTGELAAELQGRLVDPATTPRGLTLFPTSVLTEAPRPMPPALELVGTHADDFELTLETTANVLAVNEALVGQVAAEQLRSTLGPGRSLVGDSVATSHTTGLALGPTIVYRASASAEIYSEPDRETLLESVRGKPISEARAILEQHGTAEITLWPDVVDRLPEQVARINLTILPPREEP